MHILITKVIIRIIIFIIAWVMYFTQRKEGCYVSCRKLTLIGEGDKWLYYCAPACKGYRDTVINLVKQEVQPTIYSQVTGTDHSCTINFYFFPPVIIGVHTHTIFDCLFPIRYLSQLGRLI